MSKGVLGNDPFKRGAASSEPAKDDGPPKPVPVLTPQKKAAPKPPPLPAAAPPPKIVVPKPKTGPATPARRAVASLASEPEKKKPAPAIRLGAGAAKAAPEPPPPPPPAGRPPAAREPVPSASVPPAPAIRLGLGPSKAPEPPPPPPVGRPAVVRDPVPSASVPPAPAIRLGPGPSQPMPPQPRETLAPRPTVPDPVPPSIATPRVAHDPTPHSGSPHVAHNPRPHEGSPRLAHNPTPHAGSPHVAHNPKPHEGSPHVTHNPRPHEGSPDLRAGATPHVGSPAVVAQLKEREAVAHESSPEAVTGRAAGGAEALGLAHDVTEGITRPFLTAASGLYNAAKSALGLGSPGPVDTWGKDETLTRALHPVGDFLYDKYFRVTVEGAHLIPKGASIIVANHSGALPLDGPMLNYALQRERPDLAQARWLVEDQVFHAPVLGVLMNRLGAVRAHPENATRLLEEGRPVIVFPEGFLGISKPFTQRYQLKRFGRGGYVKLALKCRVPIVPVAIAGAEESMPLFAKIPAGALGIPYLPLTPPPLPSKWRIRFSEPVDVRGGSEDDLPFVQQQNDRVRDTIAGMLESLVK